MRLFSPQCSFSTAVKQPEFRLFTLADHVITSENATSCCKSTIFNESNWHFQQYVIDYLRGFSKIHFVLSGFAPHLASHFGRSVSKHSYSYVSQPINQTVLPATLQIPDPSCNMRVSRDCYEVYHQNRG
jgi:hypothetical protein